MQHAGRRAADPESGEGTGLSSTALGAGSPAAARPGPGGRATSWGLAAGYTGPVVPGPHPPMASDRLGGAREPRPPCPGGGRGADGPASQPKALQHRDPKPPQGDPTNPGTLTLPFHHSHGSPRARARIPGQVTTLSVPLRRVVGTVPGSEVRVRRQEQRCMWPWAWTCSVPPTPHTHLLELTLGL